VANPSHHVRSTVPRNDGSRVGDSSRGRLICSGQSTVSPLAPRSRILTLSEQLFYCPKDTAVLPHATAEDTLTFLAVPQSESALAGQGEDTVTVLEDTFLAASENGFMLSREDEKAWTCVTPGAQARLAW
jgi:hypothetical protein